MNKLLKYVGVAILVYAAMYSFVVVSTFAVSSYFDYSTKTTIIAATETSLLEAVNKERAANGAAPLQIHPALRASAQFKSDDMWNRNYRDHEDPETGALNGLDYINARTDIGCEYVSENIVWNEDNSTMSTAMAMDWWMNSESHRKAILDPRYTHTGFGISNNSIAVQHFCIYK